PSGFGTSPARAGNETSPTTNRLRASTGTLLRLVNHDLGGLDHRLHLVTGLQSHRLRRGAGDGPDELQRAPLDDHLGHDVAELHGLDDPVELVPGTEHGGLLSRGR